MCARKFELFLIQVVQKAAAANDAHYSTLLSYWRRRIFTALQISNADILTTAYIYLFDQGGGNLNRDLDTKRAFES